MPVPAAKITTLPSSKCFTALSRTNVSATCSMQRADITFTSSPMLSRMSCKPSELITVASIPILSALVLSISPLDLPLQKLPPPTTIATSTPLSTKSLTGATIFAAVSKLIPKRSSPAKDSPLSFKRTLLYLGVIICTHLSFNYNFSCNHFTLFMLACKDRKVQKVPGTKFPGLKALL